MGKVIPLNAQHQGAALTVADAIETFLDRDWSEHTRRNFASDLKRFRESFGRRRVERVKADEVQNYLEDLTTSRGGPERPVSAQTFNRHFGTLSNLFSWLERLEEIDRSPMAKVERRKLGERLPRPMSRDQVRAFFGRIDELRDKALFSLLYGSGLRVSEALGINIEEMSLEEREFRVVGKGDRERVGYLAEDTVKLLRRYLRGRGRPRQGPLFESRNGTRLSYSMAWRLFRKFTDGLEGNGQPLTIHQLRHSFGSERAGEMDALILRDLMGHRSLRTTLQYAQVNGESVKKAFRTYDRQRRKA
jgi:site-specific recombinase XerD